ncbi:MFS polyamine transporter [Obba rivulosa]|uniref:MFS polyamine transporter n=1 Tax=Obba rivulosa TaxID=1052685 RepID=A0A8E2DMZ4_9APHY|nr:MFS polyamine transporter [Obba rivulosa]
MAATAFSTPHSSTTTIYDPNALVIDPRIDQELRCEERRIEEYGGDDPHDPAPKDANVPSAFSSDNEYDPYKVTWDGPNDLENPQNWSVRRRWWITALCLLMTVNVSFASSAPSTAGARIALEFHKSSVEGNLVTACFLFGYVMGPSFWGPGSELVGRQWMFRIALLCYTLLHLGQALAHNIETVLVTRFLGGFFAVAPLTNCGGVIVDIWDPITRGTATSLFTAGVFIGPVLGPIIGGYIVESSLGWRWVFWVMMIFAGSCTLIAILFVPETYAPVILQRKAQRLRKADPEKNAKVYAEHERSDWSLKGIMHRTLYRPLQMLLLEPILVLVTLYLSLMYGVLYALFEALPIIFMGTRGFSEGQSGLIFIGVGIGTTLGAMTTLPLSRHYPELLKKWRGFPPPEQRLLGAMIGGPCLVVGCFWLGWTGQYASVPWIVPALATVPIGFSVSIVFISFLSYLVDTYLQYSASAFSANTIMRSAVGAGFPLFTVQMFNSLGINWACTLIGLIGLVLSPMPFLFYKYGARIRSKSRFSPCIDLRIAKELEAEAVAASKTLEKQV